MKLRWLPAIIALGLLWGGGQSVYTGLRNTSPQQMTCAEFLRTRPGGHWFHLTECEPDFLAGGYFGSTATREVFVPLRAAGEQASAPSSIVLLSKEKDLLAYVESILDPSSGAATSYDKREFKGLVKFGIELRDKERAQIAKHVTNVDSDFIVLEHEKQPHLVMGLVMLVGGILLAAYLIRRASRSGEPQSQPAAQVAART